jgi:hypothetical protein
LEPGQIISQFENEKVAIIVAEKNDITLKVLCFLEINTMGII